MPSSSGQFHHWFDPTGSLSQPLCIESLCSPEHLILSCIPSSFMNSIYPNFYIAFFLLSLALNINTSWKTSLILGSPAPFLILCTDVAVALIYSTVMTDHELSVYND